jgi:hypothetical protein
VDGRIFFPHFKNLQLYFISSVGHVRLHLDRQPSLEDLSSSFRKPFRASFWQVPDIPAALAFPIPVLRCLFFKGLEQKEKVLYFTDSIVKYKRIPVLTCLAVPHLERENGENNERRI